MTWGEMKKKMADFPDDKEFAMGFYDDMGEHHWFKIDEIAPNRFISLRDSVNCLKTWCVYMKPMFGCNSKCPFFKDDSCAVNDVIKIPSKDIPDIDMYCIGEQHADIQD